MLKGKAPFPFQTIALAVSFSPGLPRLVSEMRRLCSTHGAIAVFIHVGKKTGEKHRELTTLLSENGFHDGNTRIYWENGEVVQDILRICKHEVVDLLIIGASERENFNLPVGQIASSIATKAKCSVLVYANQSTDFKKIIVNGIEHDKTELTLQTAIYFTEKENATDLLIAEDSEIGTYADDSDETSVTTSPSMGNEIAQKTKLKLKFINIAAENSSTLSEYAFRNNIDLLITYSSDHKLLIFDRIASVNGIESLLKNLSCSLLIVHSRIAE